MYAILWARQCLFQLAKPFDCSFRDYTAANVPLRRLRCLSVNTNVPVPPTKTNLDSLTELVVFFWCDIFPWGHLGTSPESSKVVFPSLKKLDLKILIEKKARERPPETPHSWPTALHFPSLECLRVNNACKDLLYSLPTMVFPTHTPKGSISFTVTAIQQAMQLDIRSVGSLYVYIQKKPEDDISYLFYTATNYMFGKLTMAGWSTLDCLSGVMG